MEHILNTHETNGFNDVSSLVSAFFTHVFRRQNATVAVELCCEN